jgi:hypothetical protein
VQVEGGLVVSVEVVDTAAPLPPVTVTNMGEEWAVAETPAPRCGWSNKPGPAVATTTW